MCGRVNCQKVGFLHQCYADSVVKILGAMPHSMLIQRSGMVQIRGLTRHLK